MTTYYHGSRSETLEFYAGICLTQCDASASAYGEHLHEVDIDISRLNILRVDMTDDELREAIDSQEWPCDTYDEIDAAIDAGYDAVAYTDVDERGRLHDCLRILTEDAFSAIAS